MNTQKEMGKRAIFLTFAGILIITSAIIAENNSPPYYSYQNGDWEYQVWPERYNGTQGNILFDAHSHTTHSDGKLTVEQNIQWHLSNGFNACAISDHNTWDHVAEAKQIV